MHHPSSPYKLRLALACALLAVSALLSIARAEPAADAGSPPAPATKKGLCIVARPDGAYLQRLRAVNARWFYTWGARLPAPGAPAGVEFVPMIWGWHDGPGQDEIMRNMAQAGREHRFTTLLGFNEPDGKGQANLTVQQALDAWPKLVDTGVRLGSPAAIHADNQWMQDFMHGIEERHLRVDFITIHWYGGADARELLGYVERVHKLYNRPVWITEFCPADWGAGKEDRPNRYTSKQIQDFMREVIPALQSCPYVERFTWFSSRTASKTMGVSSLFNDDGSLTEVGKVYASF